MTQTVQPEAIPHAKYFRKKEAANRARKALKEDNTDKRRNSIDRRARLENPREYFFDRYNEQESETTVRKEVDVLQQCLPLLRENRSFLSESTTKPVEI
ncbi:Hypothetical protein NTJ_10253 [Nesidiocoris tenuis]|uniref:IBB domain-containing protein n=1 Tax=Nesidiocoris tenuis TaxID=355587 RepID=A0ABN7B1K5_9HEMI|nr:Hypothetical protein NTJ_10253 [Nesidiocoris tenuis]